MFDHLKPLIGKLTAFAKDRMGFQRPPRLFLRNDSENSQKMLGNTAYYDPQEKSITLFTHKRHPKDILRSYAHELVHHTQNLRGDLSTEKCGEMGTGYAQNNKHMRNMEKEAYLQGNMCFRDWEDTLNDKDTYMIKIAESKFLKENKKMTKKITKEFLKETIRKILSEEPVAGQAGVPTPQQTLDALKQGLAVNKKKVAAQKKVGRKASGGGIGRKARIQNKLIQKHFGELSLMDVQESLLKMGYYGKVQPEDLERTVDGKYGPKTARAIMAFQKDVKPGKKQSAVTVDGLAGADFLDAFAHVIQQGSTALKSGKNFDPEALLPTFDKIPDGFKHKGSQFVPGGETSMDGVTTSVPSSKVKDPNAGQKLGSIDDLGKSDAEPGQSRADRLMSKGGEIQKGSALPSSQRTGVSSGGRGKQIAIVDPYGDDEEEFLAKSGNIQKENEELEEISTKELAAQAGDKNKVESEDFEKAFGKKEKQEESKIQTPEKEKTLYEQRFSKKNTKLFEKLLKEWAK